MLIRLTLSVVAFTLRGRIEQLQEKEEKAIQPPEPKRLFSPVQSANLELKRLQAL